MLQCTRHQAYGNTDALNRTPRVLAVAIALAKVVIACVASIAFEFEIPDPGGVLVVEYY